MKVKPACAIALRTITFKFVETLDRRCKNKKIENREKKRREKTGVGGGACLFLLSWA